MVLKSSWPNNSCTVRMSEPLSNKCVANEWRNVWALAFLFTLLARTALVIARLTAASWAWWRRLTPLRGSTENWLEGKANCHFHSFAAFGSFFSSEYGR